MSREREVGRAQERAGFAHEGATATPGKATVVESLPAELRTQLEVATGIPLAHVRVHDTEHGHATAASHDARAVTIGADIYFAAGQYDPRSRDGRELIAHEVAHVAQAQAAERGGETVSAEADADTFAAAFLDRPGSMSWRPAVGAAGPMRKAATTPKVTTDVAWKYLQVNEAQFLGAIEARLALVPLPKDPHFAWVTGGLSKKIASAITGASAGRSLFITLPELVYPADPWFSIDQHRPLTEGNPGVIVDGREPKGLLDFRFLAGEAVATDVQRALATSLAHMVPRFVVQLEAKGKTPVEVADLVTSHPFDRVVARLLCDPEVVKPSPPPKGSRKRTETSDPRLFKDGVRFLTDYEWLGSKDIKLWNWIEARDPRDATPEDVAASLWLDIDASQYAYVVTQSGPFFRIDPRWARSRSPHPQYAIDEKHQDNVLDLADSSLATEAAIAQTADEQKRDRHGKLLPASYERLAATLTKSERQVLRAKDLLVDTKTKLWELVLPALHWVQKWRDALAATTDTRHAELAPVIEGQSNVLFEAVGAITEVIPMAGIQALQGKDSPVSDVLREYAIAVGESHLVDSARAHLVRANRAKNDLPLLLLERSAADTSVAVDDFIAQGHGSWGGDHVRLLEINRRVLSDMRRRQTAGEKLDAGQVSWVAASVKEQAVDARAKSLYGQLHDLMNYARDSKSGFFETMSSVFDSDIRELPNKLGDILTDLRETVIEPHDAAKKKDLANITDDAYKAQVLGQITHRTETRLSDFVDRHDLKKRMSTAVEVIQKQEKRTAVIRIVTQIVILIGASVAGGIAGNMVAGAIRGAMVADAATASLGMLRVANAAGTIAGLTVDATINAGAQLAVQGGDAKEAFTANFLGSAAVRIALAPLSHAAQAWGGAADEIKNVGAWGKVRKGSKIVLHEGAVLTTSMITAAATDYVVHRIYHSKETPTEKQAIDWAIQGGSMAIGSFVGRWTKGFEARAVQFAEHQGQLLARARKMQKLAAEVKKTGNEQAALELIIQRNDALREEARLIEELSRSPTSHISKSQLETLRRGNLTETGAVKEVAFEMVPLRLGGLAPDDASGTVWTGHRAQIEMALEQSRRAGLDVQVLRKDPQTNTWHVRYQNREISIVETHTKSAAILSGDDAALREAALNIKPIAGWRDVAVHGTIDDFEILVNGKVQSVDHRSLAAWLRKGGDGKQRIRLLSCETGKHAKGAAQHLANKLGVEVMAPNDILHVFEDGSMVIGPTPTRNTGSWETFKPQKAERRFSQPKDKPTERAIDRLHRARAEEGKPFALGDDGVERIPLVAKSNLDDARIAGGDHAERLGARVGGNVEPIVRDIAIKSNAADVQVEAGLRVIDTLVGSQPKGELKRVAKKIASAPESAGKQQDLAAFDHVGATRDAIQNEMLDVLRDPSLDLAARKTKLHAATDKVEAAAAKLPELKLQPFVAQTRRAIDALDAKVFDDMISVDANGNLSQHGKPAGRLADLMEHVRTTNAALARHGVAEEYVISVSMPRDPAVPREVKILSRKPRDVDADPLTAKRRAHAKVDPSDPTDDGLVLDVGVGTSDYARDVGGERGQIVKTEYGGSYADPAMKRRDLTWEHTASHLDVDSVVILGDALQTLPMVFAGKSVKRVFINNINAHYDAGGDRYRTLARGLRQVMTQGGRVEVQWTTALETTGGKTQSRGHITGDDLKAALLATAADMPRKVSIDENAAPVTDYDYSVEAPRTLDGKPSKTPPSNPVPEKRWIFKFED
jgi:hypothetical protein